MRNALDLVRRRARDAGIATPLCCHSFRATGITVYLENGGTLENAQRIAAHESPRTTKLYDRTGDQIEPARPTVKATSPMTRSAIFTTYQSGGADQPRRQRITAAATHPKRRWPASATHVNSVKPKKGGNPATR